MTVAERKASPAARGQLHRLAARCVAGEKAGAALAQRAGKLEHERPGVPVTDGRGEDLDRFGNIFPGAGRHRMGVEFSRQRVDLGYQLVVARPAVAQVHGGGGGAIGRGAAARAIVEQARLPRADLADANRGPERDEPDKGDNPSLFQHDPDPQCEFGGS
jgi:hypothetical protein